MAFTMCVISCLVFPIASLRFLASFLTDQPNEKPLEPPSSPSGPSNNPPPHHHKNNTNNNAIRCTRTARGEEREKDEPEGQCRSEAQENVQEPSREPQGNMCDHLQNCPGSVMWKDEGSSCSRIRQAEGSETFKTNTRLTARFPTWTPALQTKLTNVSNDGSTTLGHGLFGGWQHNQQLTSLNKS